MTTHSLNLGAWTAFFRAFLKRPLAVAALVWAIVVTLACALAGAIAPNDPLDQDLGALRQLPGSEHLLGTDTLGRDLLSRLLHGGQTTLLGVAVAVGIAVAVGVVLGIVSGFISGRTDSAISAVIDVLLSIPLIVVLLTVLSIFDQRIVLAMAAVGLLGSAFIARVVRSASRSVRQDLYVDAARVNGRTELGIMVQHVLPRVIGPIFVQVSIFACTALVAQSGINFLGLGFRPPHPTWGGMVAEAASSISDFPWLMVPPALVIASMVLAFGLLGDALRDSAVHVWRGQGTDRGHAGVSSFEAEPVVHAPGQEATTPDLAVSSLVVTTATGKRIVDGVSLNLRSGEVLGVVGESGSGKSTVVMACLGLLPEGLTVESGTLTVRGRQVDLRSARAGQALWGTTMSYVSQDPLNSLDPCQSIGSALTEVLRYRGVRGSGERRDQALALLSRVHINDPEAVYRKYPHQISGGMAQRIAIARALATGSTIIVADEPTTALDVTVQWEILSLLHELRDSLGLAILLVTHDWGVVADLCDRTVVMHRGLLVESGSTEQIMYSAQHPYTQSLLANITGPQHTVQDGTENSLVDRREVTSTMQHIGSTP